MTEIEDVAAEPGQEIAAVRDVLVVPSPGHHVEDDDWMNSPPAAGPVRLGNGVVVERLIDDTADQVIAASIPAGLNFAATRQFGQLYSFWRRVPRAEYEADLYAWDTSRAISEAIALSRLVIDNAHCAEFAGRVIDRADGHRKIVPLLGLDGRVAYRARNDRSWLTTDEAGALRTLLERYRAVKHDLPDRVRRGLWHADRSSFCRYLTEAVTNIVTGLEALLNTGDDEPVTAQFVKRSQRLAAELGTDTSRTYWSWVYDVRSKAVHGDEVTLVAPPGWTESSGDLPLDVARVAKAQDVLRAAIRRSIEDDAFCAAFASDEAVRQIWPLE